MAYHTIIRTEPVAFYPLDSSPYVDRSHKRAPNLSLANYVHPLWSFNYGKLAICPPSFSVPAAVTKSNVWSVAANVKVISGSPKLFEFASSGGTGLSYSNGVLTFKLVHADASETTVNYPHKFKKVHDVYCVVDTKSAIMYIDGLKVASSDIVSSSPVVAGTSVQFGDSTGSLAIGGVVIWDKAITSSMILDISNAYRRHPYRRELFETNSVAAYTPEVLSIKRFESEVVPGSVVDAVIVATGHYMAGGDETGLSIAGSVSFSYFVPEESLGVAVYWNREYQTTVEFSTDAGQTWTALPMGRRIPGTGQSVGGVTLLVRATFAAGLQIRPFIDGLRIVDYQNSLIDPRSFTNRQATIIGDVYIPMVSHHPQIHGDGMRLFSSAIVELLPDTNEVTQTTAAIELVYSPAQADLTGTKYIINSSPEHASNIAVTAGKLTFTGFSSVYVNGVSTTTNALTMREGLSYHIVANYTAANNAKVTFGMENSSVNGPISTFGIHNAALSAGKALSTFESYLRYPVASLQTDGALNFTDGLVSFYSKDWTTGGA